MKSLRSAYIKAHIDGKLKFRLFFWSGVFSKPLFYGYEKLGTRDRECN